MRLASLALIAASVSTTPAAEQRSGAREVFVHPDCEGGNHWMVDWGDRDSGCYVTTFDGPMAEQRAREYFDALKAGRLKVLREIE